MLIYSISYINRYKYICNNKITWRAGAGEIEGRRRQPSPLGCPPSTHTHYGCIHTHTHVPYAQKINKCSKKCNPWSGGGWGGLCLRVMMRKSGKHCSSDCCFIQDHHTASSNTLLMQWTSVLHPVCDQCREASRPVPPSQYFSMAVYRWRP